MAAYLIEKVTRVEPLLLSLPLGEQQVLVTYSNSLHLIRSKICKNHAFSTPFSPFTEVLLLFPEGIHTETENMVATATSDLTRFFHVLQDTFSLSFQIKDAAGCLSSGTLLFVLECGKVDEAIQVMEKAEDLARQSHPILWSSALHVRAMMCERTAVEKLLQNGCSGGAEGAHDYSALKEVTRHYYAYPVCLICADRLEGTATGYTRPVVCRCAENGGHCSCLQSSQCKVCKLFMRTFQPRVSEDARSNAIRCDTCGRVEDPWVCLICGYIGCSRYQAMHAKEHYMNTMHCFSMNLLTQEVWDYESDRFTHRMVFCIDNNTGGASRIQFPDREEPEQCLHPAKEEETRQKKGTKAKVEKKTISTKFDAQLSTSHTQYSIMIKNELDASRSPLDVEATLHLAYHNALRGFTRLNRPRTELSSDIFGNGDALLQQMKEAANNYEESYRTHEAAKGALHELQKEKDALCKEKEALSQKLRGAIKGSVEENLKLEGEINELRTVLAEIKANVSAGAALSARVGGNDGIASMVAIGTAGEGQCKRRSRKK